MKWRVWVRNYLLHLRLVSYGQGAKAQIKQASNFVDNGSRS